MEVSQIVKTIHEQLLVSGRMKVWSWGTHNWIAINEFILQFKVQGHHFTGHVRVEYDVAEDWYDIHFGHFQNHRWNNVDTIVGIYCDDMVDVIDQKVEYIADYTSR